MIIADEALVLYKQKQTSPKGAFNEFLAYARKRAKEMAVRTKKSARPLYATAGHDREKNIHVYRTAPINY